MVRHVSIRTPVRQIKEILSLATSNRWHSRWWKDIHADANMGESGFACKSGIVVGGLKRKEIIMNEWRKTAMNDDPLHAWHEGRSALFFICFKNLAWKGVTTFQRHMRQQTKKHTISEVVWFFCWWPLVVVERCMTWAQTRNSPLRNIWNQRPKSEKRSYFMLKTAVLLNALGPCVYVVCEWMQKLNHKIF